MNEVPISMTEPEANAILSAIQLTLEKFSAEVPVAAQATNPAEPAMERLRSARDKILNALNSV